MSKAIPDRWLKYKPIGDRLPGTRFIAFKVPLNQHVNARVQENCRLAPESLLESVPDLGLIIDLTNTNRYYHPSALTNHNVCHQKLMIPGKKTPKRNLAEKFCGIVADFLESNADNDKLIGVHCTHGVNRTGYLICYFMITIMNKSPEEAIQTFSSARGHQIERVNYLSSLRTLENRKPPSTDRSEDWRQQVTHNDRRLDRLTSQTVGWKRESYQEHHDHRRDNRWFQKIDSRSYGQDREGRQDRTQGNRSGGGYQPSWIRHDQNYHRSRNYSERIFSDRNYSERICSDRNYSERNQSRRNQE
ncbi:RNA/RNP complex-1-interacting phosphatase isoform X2 [Drosophila erecta]|uniref:Uncharacterized protein n=1 Tax=Drosophila erecta TaxID=7220 RepID=B3NSD6_DROER|nr:RNA/RNP complex-1-interacting phosphatase isoform X2 [Drosophila erecta]EDV56438.1 uncharacterized protein Dere_GG20215 [Drosophila erecta]